MPRKLELTFQKGANGRSGRWKKFYRGKTHYVGSGRCKTDVPSYKAALAEWQKLKVKLDAEVVAAPRPRDREYDEVIGEWELVLSWAVQHGEDDEAAVARDKLAELRIRREKAKQPAVTHADRLWSRFRPDQKILKEIGELADASMGPAGTEEFRRDMLQKSSAQPAKRSAKTEDIGDVNPLRRAEIQWEDRIESQRNVATGVDDHTLGGWTKLYMTKQHQRVDADDLSVGRYVSEKAALEHFRDWAGAQVDVATISGQTLSRYHAYLLELIASDDCAPSYARDRMTSARSLIRWLWGQDAVEDLPKNIDSHELRIGRRPKTPQTLELSEVSELLRKSSGRTRLYILLGLNCGMTQKDISDLLDVDISWDKGTIKRKRSKTHKHPGVPTVTHKLWPETLELLREFRSGSDVVLLNRNGNRLVETQLTKNGSYRKTDNIKNAYERVLRKTSFSKPFTVLRKTSATFINADSRYRGLDQLFLGHAPGTIAEKHYTATSKSALDEAIDFLRKMYKVDKIDDTVAEAQ